MLSRLIVAVWVLAIAALASAMPFYLLDGTTDPLDGFTVCSSNDATFTPHSLTYAPNPPVSGQPLVLTVEGELRANVSNSLTANATVAVTGSKFGIQLFSQNFNVCDNVACPIYASGNATLTLNFTVPSIPSQFKGQTANVKAIATNGDGVQIVCLQNPNFKA